MTRGARRTTDLERGYRIQVGIGDAQPRAEQPLSSRNQPSQPPQQQPIFYDSSGPLFSLYSEIAKEEDNKMTDLWQADATDGILVFTGLFSAALAALLTVSVQDLKPNPQAISAFYLANIYQVLADPNATAPRISAIPSTLPVPPQFSPPTYAVWVNALWFLSLVVAFTCALLAMLLRQWARRYIRVTQPARCSPDKRARMRAFFAGGVDQMGVPLVVEGLPAMLHFSLFLFFSGLVIFLLNANHAVYLPVACWIGLFSTVYGCITFMPLFWHHSPYYTPLSTPASLISVPILTVVAGVLNLVLFCVVWIGVALYATLRYCITFIGMIVCSCTRVCNGSRLPEWRNSDANLRWFMSFAYRPYLRRLFIDIWLAFPRWPYGIGNIGKAAEEITSKRSSEIDLGILDWTIGALGEDDKLERFFEAIPGFFNSQMVKDLKRPLPTLFRSKFVDSLCGFLGRNLLSTSVNEDIKTRRLVVCMNATKEICDSHDIHRILSHLSHLPFDQVPQSIQTAEILARSFARSDDHHISRHAREPIANILLCLRERNSRWIALARDQFGIPECVLLDNLAHGDDSVLLAILIHVTQQVVRTDPSDWRILLSLSKFDVLHTRPGLQNEFCALWNGIVLEARDTHSSYVDVLHSIHHLYVALHQAVDATPTAFSPSHPLDFVLNRLLPYRLCNLATHNPSATVPRPNENDNPHDDSRLPS